MNAPVPEVHCTTAIDPIAALKDMLAARAAGDDVGPQAVAAYEAFARWTAEVWFLRYHPGSVAAAPQGPRLTEAEHLDMVAQVNREVFGRTDNALDRQCATAVRQAFLARKQELQAGWTA